jgi:hypothetical protein
LPLFEIETYTIDFSGQVLTALPVLTCTGEEITQLLNCPFSLKAIEYPCPHRKAKLPILISTLGFFWVCGEDCIMKYI